ncbi:MAG: glycosyltransferase family 39 protein [Candidatus Nanoarchaeia archaeon]
MKLNQSSNKKISKFTKNKQILTHALAVGAIAVGIIILSFLGVYGTTIFADFAVIFDGGYRIFLGQTPYQDFFMPVGPITMYLLGFFNHIMGPTLNAMVLQVAVLSLILSLLFYSIVVKYFGKVFSVFLALCFHLSYTGVIGYPWYTETAFFFFVLNLLLIVKFFENKKINKYLLAISAILAILSFYSKQDTGCLHFLSVLVYFSYTYYKDIKKVLLYYFIPYIILIPTIFFSAPGMSTWFMLSNDAMGSRLATYFSIEYILIYVGTRTVYSLSAYLSLFLLYLLWKEKNFDARRIIILLLGLNITLVIVQLTSSLYIQTSVMALPLNLFLFYCLIEQKMIKGKLNSKTLHLNRAAITFAILFIVLLLQLGQLSTGSLATYFKTPPEQAINILGTHNPKIDTGCYKGTPINPRANEDLNKIRTIIEENDKDVFIIGYYGFLYCDYNLTPPKNMFLWFDEGITHSKEDVSIITNYIINEKPNVVLVQYYGSNYSKQKINETLTKEGYNWAFTADPQYKYISEDIRVFVLANQSS